MELIDKVRLFISNLDEKEFKTYLFSLVSGITLALFFIVFFYARKTTSLKKQLHHVNTKREEIRTILDKYEEIELKQQTIDQLLEENKNFKIRGYFEDVLTQLGLDDKKTSELETTKAEQDTKYIETTLKASLGGLSMKQTCELLEKLEHNAIVYTKELEIAKAKKPPRTVDIMITIATLQPTEPTERTE